MTPSPHATIGAACLTALLLVLPWAGAWAQDAQAPGRDEGIVFGSVKLIVAREDPNESPLAFLGNSKARELDYRVWISEKGGSPLKLQHSVLATPGNESHFVKKLPAGTYRMDYLRPSGLLVPQLSFGLGLDFDVKPMEVTYVGRVIVSLPNRIGVGGGRYSIAVQDARQDAVDALKADHPEVAADARTALVRSERALALVPGNTIASPQLQQDTLTIVLALDGAEDAQCARRTVVSAENIKRPSRQGDSGEEIWTLDRCGKSMRYRVTFTPSAGGGVDIRAVPAN